MIAVASAPAVAAASRTAPSVVSAPPPEEGHDGLSTVMLEIRANADSEAKTQRRLKAIEANQKARSKEIQARGDEFQDELNDFVSQKKLKMTGGAEEAERIRFKKDQAALKSMFSGAPPILAGAGEGAAGGGGALGALDFGGGFGGGSAISGLTFGNNDDFPDSD